MFWNNLQKTFYDYGNTVSLWLLPSLARLVFAGVLLVYFLNSARSKFGEGIFGFINPSPGAYAQIFPKTAEEYGYVVSQFSFVHDLIVIAGSLSEYVLPLMIVVGLFTRLAAFGMVGFVVVQSVVDIYGHGTESETIGTWFDGYSNSLIADQRSFWVFLLICLILKGAGPISIDRLLVRVIESLRI